MRAWRAAAQLTEAQEADGMEPALLRRDALMSALHGLPHRQRAVIVLRYLAELTEAEPAAVLEVSVGTVKHQSFDALARLRPALDTAPQQETYP